MPVRNRQVCHCCGLAIVLVYLFWATADGISGFGSDVEMPHGLFDDEQAIESLAVVFLIDQFLFV